MSTASIKHQSMISPEIQNTIQPLVDAAVKARLMEGAYMREAWHGGSGKVIFQSRPVNQGQRAAYMMYQARAEEGRHRAISERISSIFSIMDEMAPEVVSAEGMVHDPYKAEHAAYEMKPMMDKSTETWFNFRRGRLIKKANLVGILAMAEYDKNPLNPEPADARPRYGKRLAKLVFSS